MQVTNTRQPDIYATLYFSAQFHGLRLTTMDLWAVWRGQPILLPCAFLLSITAIYPFRTA
mgnify:CR=1 FL=1